MRPYSFVFIIVALAAGLVAGYVLRPYAQNRQQQMALQDLAAETGVNLDACLASIDATPCADALIRSVAVREQRLELCGVLLTSAAEADCAAQVEFVRSLGENARICEGAGASSVCLDTVALLAAAEAQDISKCNRIQSALLLQTCERLVSGEPSEASNGGVLAQRSRYTYGLQCDSTDPFCVQNKRVFNQAVRTGQASVCEQMDLPPAQCQLDTLIYQAFTTGNAALCDTQQDAAASCKFQVTLAKALDAGDPALCAQAASPQDQEACVTVLRTNKEKRFDYLQESL